MKSNTSRLSTFMHNLSVVLNDDDRKPFHQISKELLITSWKTKCFATHYFTDCLYKKYIHNYSDYLCHKEWQNLQRAVSDKETIDILGDKLYFHKYFENTNIPLPNLLAYNVRETVIIKQRNVWTTFDLRKPETSLRDILILILNLSGNGTIFIKSTKGTGGIGIRRISMQNNELTNDIITEIWKDIIKGSYIFEEAVIQHETMAKLNPGTLNTVRMDTFKATGKKPEIISAYLRTGRKGSCVDNLASGGYRIGINLENGNLKSYGLNKLSKGGQRVAVHPDTGIAFEGFQIPFFEDVKRFAIETANWLPKALIGWDIAVSNHGPVIIEGNTVFYDMSDSDIAYGGYRNNPMFHKIVEFVKKDLRKQR